MNQIIKYILCSLCIVFIQCLFFKLYSQDYGNVFFNHITSENIRIEKGLSQNTVYAIIRDNEGFMWFGTWDGLNKYDGNKFTVYNKATGLSNETIYSILQDSTGLIWIGTENGLNTINPQTGAIKSYYNNPDDSTSLSSNYINQVYIDKKGQIWVATVWGLNKYRRETDDFRRYLSESQDNTAVRNNCVNRIYYDQAGYYWIATNYGLIRYDVNSRTINRYYYKPDDPSSLADNHINTIIKDTEGNLWVGTRHGLSCLQPKSKTFRNYFHNPENDSGISNNNITSILEDQDKNIWIGTDGGGLNLYDKTNDKFSSFQKNNLNIHSISNNKVFCLYEDNVGTIWIGTFMGVNKIDRYFSKFTVYRSDQSDNTLNNNFIRDFFEFKPGIIWIGTENGINIFNEKKDAFSYLEYDPDNSNSISSNHIRDIFRDSEGMIWIGTSDSGLTRYDVHRNNFTRFKSDPKDPNSIGGNFILCIQEHNNKNIWISVNHGLSVFNKNTGRFKNYLYNPEDPSTAGLNRIYDIHQDKTGQLWFASQNGLSCYNPENDSFCLINIEPQNKSKIVSNKIFSIYEDNSGNLWLSTRGGGLVKYNNNTGQFKIYSEKDGLPNNVVYGLLKDNEGNLWISTNWGISKFDPEHGHFINYDHQDGLQSNEFNANAFLKTSDGKMYFGGMNGFNCFFPDKIKSNPNAPPVLITGFNVFNEPKPLTFYQKDTIHLNYNDNFFSIEFAALDYTNPSKNKYKYILDGFDKRWRTTGADNAKAEYTRVDPGIYTFNVKGSNNDGVWNNNGAKLTIDISPPWWKSPAFLVPFSIIVLGSIYLIFITRFRVLKNKHEAEKKVLKIERKMFELEQKSLQLQMNPHFIFNSLNSIQSFVLENDTDTAVNYLAKFSKLIRLTLSNSRASYISLKDELTSLRYYMDIEKLRFDNKFDYNIILDLKIDEDFIEIPPMIIQPYVENAIIHGLVNSPGKGEIKISFKVQGDNLFCCVEDNGIGREKAEMIKKESGFSRKSRGMMITKERLDVLNKQHNRSFTSQITDLKDREGNPTGTKVEINIPFRES